MNSRQEQAFNKEILWKQQRKENEGIGVEYEREKESDNTKCAQNATIRQSFCFVSATIFFGFPQRVAMRGNRVALVLRKDSTVERTLFRCSIRHRATSSPPLRLLNLGLKADARM